MTTETNPSPLPWRVAHDQYGHATIEDYDGDVVLELPDNDADGYDDGKLDGDHLAAILVSAVNERPALLAEVAALRAALTELWATTHGARNDVGGKACRCARCDAAMDVADAALSGKGAA